MSDRNRTVGRSPGDGQQCPRHNDPMLPTRTRILQENSLLLLLIDEVTCANVVQEIGEEMAAQRKIPEIR